MSEYQHYAFRAIDKPLSESEKKEIGTWSSRTNPSNNGASFTYHYGDFPKDVMKVVANYFDAFFYISNWGTTRLVFKFPSNLIDVRQLKQYCIMDGLDIIEKPEFVLLDICIEDQEGGGRWIEEDEDWLTSLESLRNDILSGDYRCLYLIWLKVCTEDVLSEWRNVDPECREPKVPDNLNSLSGTLKDFAEIFEIDKDAIAAASQNSIFNSAKRKVNHADRLDLLTDAEKDQFLVRLIQKEPLLSIKLKKRLMEFDDQRDKEVVETGRTVAAIVSEIQALKEKRKLEKARKKEEQRLAKLEKLEKQEVSLWNEVDLLIKEKKTNSYDEAIKILKELKVLAIHKKRQGDFKAKVQTIQQKYSRLSALQGRIESCNLV
jgi:hypothetical protein